MTRRVKKGSAAKKRRIKVLAREQQQLAFVEHFTRRLEEVLEEQRLNPLPRYISPGLGDETW